MLAYGSYVISLSRYELNPLLPGKSMNRTYERMVLKLVWSILGKLIFPNDDPQIIHHRIGLVLNAQLTILTGAQIVLNAQLLDKNRTL